MNLFPPPEHSSHIDLGDVEPYVRVDAKSARIVEAVAIAEAARAYVAARKRNEEAEPADWERRLCDVDYSWHRLLVACGVEA